MGIGSGSLSPHRGIDLIAARLLIPFLASQRHRLAHELCGHIDHVIESHLLDLRVKVNSCFLSADG